MLRVLVFALALSTSGAAPQSKGWRGLVPLHSTCDDAKRVVGLVDCRNTTFNLEDVNVSMIFSDGTCGSGWRVAAGTVVSFTIYPKAKLALSSLELDQAVYKRRPDSHLSDVVHYENKNEGIAVTTSKDGIVTSLFYGPSTRDASLSCTSTDLSNLLGHRSVKFDEYSIVELNEEHERLDRFAIELKAWPTVLGYIISSGQNQPHEGVNRSNRAKEYLVKQGIPAERITCIDGGFRKDPLIELYLVIK